MSIDVGTIVTRYSSYDKVRTCEDGVCVGKIVKIDQKPSDPDNPIIEVKWWEACKFHVVFERLMLDETWEIGQIPQK